MGKTKPKVSKKPKKGVDFKKIKRKIGRKLPPPKNFTDTRIKSKAIILPEQTVAIEKEGLAINKKGLTLKELLQQTSHHNIKMRKAALAGIHDFISKHPSELKLHKIAVIEKLKERICDNDKGVRETLYQILKAVIFPSLKEDITGPVISLLMPYVFNAMTHIVVDIRLMAFRFFELIVLNYPSSFAIYTDQVLDNYTDILRNYQIYLQEKNHLKNVLGGLVNCLSFLVSKGEEDGFNELNIDDKRCLHSYTSEAHYDGAKLFSDVKNFQDLVPGLIHCFQESVLQVRLASSIDSQSFDCLSCTLCCINLLVKLSIEKMNKFQARHELLASQTNGGPHKLLILLKKLWEAFPIGQMHHSNMKDYERYFALNVKIAETFLHLFQWIDDRSFPVEKFLEFLESFLLGNICSSSPSDKALLRKHLRTILPFTPKLISQAPCSWRTPLLKAFTVAFKDCKVDSPICQLFLGAIKEMILPTASCSMLLCNYSEMLNFQVDWLRELPRIVCSIGDKHVDISKDILELLLCIGQSCLSNSSLALEYDHLQFLLTGFYSSRSLDDAVIYGPFIKLPIDCQELAICCLYYFSNLTIDLFESLALCSLNPGLDISMVIRIAEVLYSAYRAGHVYISHIIGFLFTLIARFKVYPKLFGMELKDGEFSNRGAFRFLTGFVCSCLTQMGDNSLVLKLLGKNIFDEILQKPSLDNSYGMLKLIITLDIRPSKLSDENACALSIWLTGYINDAASYIPEETMVDVQSDQFRIFKYYIQPCIILFCRNGGLLLHVLELFASAINEDNFSAQSKSEFSYSRELSAKIHAVSSILISMHNDKRCHESLSQSKDVIKLVVQNIGLLLDSTVFCTTLEEKQKLQLFRDRLNRRFEFPVLE